MMHDTRTDMAFALSLSEISALSARAARGGGRSWGEAEEVAEATCWLARAGLDWAGPLLEVLTRPDPGADCALRAGIALADAAPLSDAPLKAQPVVNCPWFLLPFVARVADQTGQRIRLAWHATQVVIAPGACPLIVGAVRIAGPVQVTITSEMSDIALCPDWPQSHRGSVSAQDYARLNQLMMAFVVPTSAHSQARAGAQGNDND